MLRFSEKYLLIHTTIRVDRKDARKYLTLRYLIHTRLFLSEKHFKVPEWCRANLFTILTIQKTSLKVQTILKEGAWGV
jgi:hypothetical protein